MAKSGMNKFIDLLRLTDPDDEYEDDLFDDDDDYDDDDYPPKKPVKQKQTKQKQSQSKLVSAPTYEDPYDDDYEDDHEPPVRKQKKQSKTLGNKLVSINSRNNNNNNRSGQLYVIKPQEFNEAQTVTDFLKEGRTIVINMEGIEVNAAQRIIDFIGGACYALDGSLQAISSNIFIAAPQNIDVSGDLRDEILNGSTISPNLGVY